MEKNTIVKKKEKPSIIKTVGNVATWKVNAYSGGKKQKDGSISPIVYLGTGQVDCFTEDDKGVEGARKAFDLDSLKDQNRQRKTDVRNNVARGMSDTAGLKALQKDDPETFDLLMKVAVQMKEGKVDPALAAKLQSKMKS